MTTITSELIRLLTILAQHTSPTAFRMTVGECIKEAVRQFDNRDDFSLHWPATIRDKDGLFIIEEFLPPKKELDKK